MPKQTLMPARIIAMRQAAYTAGETHINGNYVFHDANLQGTAMDFALSLVPIAEMHCAKTEACWSSPSGFEYADRGVATATKLVFPNGQLARIDISPGGHSAVYSNIP